MTSYGGSFNAAAFNTGALNADPAAFVIVSGEILPATQVVAGLYATREVTGAAVQSTSGVAIPGEGVFVRFSRSGTLNSFPIDFLALNSTFETSLTGDVSSAAITAASISNQLARTGSTGASAVTAQSLFYKQNAIVNADPAATSSIAPIRPYIAFAISTNVPATVNVGASLFANKAIVGATAQAVTVTALAGAGIAQIFARGAIALQPLATLTGTVSKQNAVDPAHLSVQSTALESLIFNRKSEIGASAALASMYVAALYKETAITGATIQSATVAANVGSPAVFQIFARGSLTMYPFASLTGDVSKIAVVDPAHVSAELVIP